MTPSLKTILGAAVDYAGIFPPANTDMATSIRNYVGYLAGPRGWALGRFVLPVSRLEEFSFHVGELETGGEARLLRLSALVGDDVEADLEKVRRFNRWHADRDGRLKAVIEVVEVKAAFSEAVRRTAEAAHDSLRVFFDIPIEQDPGELAATIARAGAAAKVRTGGIAPDMFPRVESLIRFLDACLRAGVRFKATGGLHYPFHGVRPLVPEPDSPRSAMYGYLNLLLCAAFMYDGMSPGDAIGVLTEESADAFTFADDGVGWRDRRVAVDALIGSRRDFAVSFGSASFEGPMDHLSRLNLA